MDHTYALILAGGNGTRFWPLSRDSHPKQLIRILSDETLFSQSVERIAPLIPYERIFVLTNEKQAQEIMRQAPHIPEQNIIQEPLRRDTAPAISLGMGIIRSHDPEATVIILPSDQLIRNRQVFQDSVRDALQAAASHPLLLTIGIKPTWPCPSYGYIKRGRMLPIDTGKSAYYEADRFCEKPDIDTARQYLTEGGYSWNAGIFIWKLETAISQLSQHCPELSKFIIQLSKAPDQANFIRSHFPQLTPISIDYALMEHADNVANMEASFDWDDVGSWISASSYMDSISGNRTNTGLTSIDSSDNIVFSKQKGKHIALLGVDDLIIVDTEDALLIARKDRADDIKKVVSHLPDHLL